MSTAIALKDQFRECRFISYPYGWWDKEVRVMIFFEMVGKYEFPQETLWAVERVAAKYHADSQRKQGEVSEGLARD